MADLVFDREKPDVGANALNAKLEECRAGALNVSNRAECRNVGHAFIDNILSLPPSEQRKHLDRAQQINEASVKREQLFPQLDIVYSRSSGKLSDVKLIVPEHSKAYSFDLFDP